MSGRKVLIRLRLPPKVYRSNALTQNHIRLRISPEVTIAMGMMVIGEGQDLAAEAVEMVASRHLPPEEMNKEELQSSHHPRIRQFFDRIPDPFGDVSAIDTFLEQYLKGGLQ